MLTLSPLAAKRPAFADPRLDELLFRYRARNFPGTLSEPEQAQWLQQYPNYAITVEGHADERGTREYNIALGARRAAATRDYLASQGVPAGRMRTNSFGKERPVAVCDDISCWSQNRRAVTVLGGAGS